MDVKEKSFARMIFEEKSLGFERLIMLCDGVFAIAMTLLVLDIKLPENVDLSTNERVYEVLLELLAKGAFYLLTFFTVAAYWTGHRRLITYVKRQDGMFTLLTFLFLAFVVFFPAAFNITVSHGNIAPIVIFYTLVLAGCGFSSFLTWSYASWHHRLIDPEISRYEIISKSLNILINPCYFCLSLLILLIPHIEAYTVFYTWAFVPFASRFVMSIYNRWGKRWQSEQNAQVASHTGTVQVTGGPE